MNKKKILPPTILNSDDYLECLLTIINYFRKKLLEKEVRFDDPNTLISDIRHLNVNIDESFLLLAAQKLTHLTNLLEVAEMNFFKPLNTITTAALFLASYTKGFKSIFQPNPLTGDIMEPTLTLACMDASVAISTVFKSFPSVILTSGTISPL